MSQDRGVLDPSSSSTPEFTREWLSNHIQHIDALIPILAKHGKGSADDISMHMADLMIEMSSQTTILVYALTRQLVADCMSDPRTNQLGSHRSNSRNCRVVEAQDDVVSRVIVASWNYISKLFAHSNEIPVEVTRYVFDSLCGAFCHDNFLHEWAVPMENYPGNALSDILSRHHKLGVYVWGLRNSERLRSKFGADCIDKYFMELDSETRSKMIQRGMYTNFPCDSSKLIQLHFASEYPGVFDDVPVGEMSSEWVIATFLLAGEKISSQWDTAPKLRQIVEHMASRGSSLPYEQEAMSKEVRRILSQMEGFSVGLVTMFLKARIDELRALSIYFYQIGQDLLSTKTAILGMIALEVGNKHVADIVFEFI